MAESLLKPLKNIYENETARQNTFIYLNWPRNAPVWPILLAKAGFYYQGKDMNVICFSCGIETSVEDWTKNVHPQQMHFKLNPDCEFINLLLKPEGGSQTFNDREKWNIAIKNEATENKTVDVPAVDEEIIDKDHAGDSKSMVTNVSDLIKGKDTLDCQNRNFVTNMTSLPSYTLWTPSTSRPPEYVQNTSHDSGFGTTTLSTVSCDAGPPSTISRDNLVISGQTLYSSFSPNFSPALRNFTPTSISSSSFMPSVHHELPIIQKDTTPISSSDTVSSLHNQMSTFRSDDFNVTFKHPDMETVPARLETFDTWPHKDIQPPKDLVTAGFFFTLDNDIIRCFCCDLGLSEWDANDDAWKEHARHSPNCWYLIRVKGQRYIDDIQRDWKKIYNPKFPNLMDEQERVKTFQNWPNLINRPTSLEIAKAGFFYVGRGDECRCHYCDGGLQHWENDDNPWEQHAYYFSHCKYVIKMKGRDFIREVRERFDARGPEVDALIRESEELEAAKNRVDVRDRKIEEALLKPELKDIYNFGYSKKAVKMACVEIFNQRGDFNFTPEEILNMILDIQDRGEDVPGDGDEEEDEKQGEATPAKPLLSAGEFMKTINQQEPLEDAVKVLEENKALKEGMRCWKCRKEEICMLFTPCGHRLTCENCSKNINYCLKCNKRVKKKYKTFLA